MQTIRLVAADGALIVESQEDISKIDANMPVTLVVLFDSSWAKYAKVAEFRNSWGTELKPQILKNGYSCTIPSKAFDDELFTVTIIGRNVSGEIIKTGRVKISRY